jgi:hypothetical protein
MWLSLIGLEEIDDGEHTVGVSPIVFPAESLEKAEEITFAAAQELGFDVFHGPALLGSQGASQSDREEGSKSESS